jgi:small subunit ribosomal protein S6
LNRTGCLSALSSINDDDWWQSRGKEDSKMRDYEVVVILQADLEEAVIAEHLEKIAGWIVAGKGVVTKTETWGKRKLAYLIRKQRDGHYTLFHAQMPPESTSELEHNLRLLEPVLRFMIIAAGE